MTTLKRQRVDGNWEYLQMTGEDVITLKNDVAAHLADNTKHVTSQEKTLIAGALQRTGGRLSGSIAIDNNAPFIELNETDQGKKYFLVADGKDFTIREDNLAENIYPFQLLGAAKKATTYGNEILHTGNLASLGVGKIVTGNYVGNETNNRFIYLGFTPKYVKITQKGRNTTGPFSQADYNTFVPQLGFRVSSGTGTNSYAWSDSEKYGIDTNGFWVSRNGMNLTAAQYEYLAIG
ncbi:hypothetical protein [Cytobacillus praedii]|uniref:hypothetical protein n=1 Tax=Cytobacillus praedii TaxID=1742358 RepID=UPI003AF4C516